MAKLDSLIVDLQVNTAELRKGLDDANAKLKDFDDKLKDLAGVVEFQEIGRMALEAGEKLADFALQGAEAAENLVHLSQSTGTSVEELQRLEFAAKAGGLQGDELARAFTKLDQSLAKAAAGVPQQAALFQAMGVAVKDAGGNVRSTNDVLGDLAERFGMMADGASKATLAAEVFGTKNGAALIPLLNSLKETEAEADRLGVVVNEAGIKAAAGFAENLNKLGAALDTVKTRVAAQLGPALEDLSKQLLTSKDGAQALKDLADVLTTALRLLTTVAVAIAAAFQVVGTTLAHNVSAIVNAAQGNFKEAFNDLKGSVTDAVDAVKSAGDRISAVWKSTGDAADTAGKKVAGALNPDRILANSKSGEKAITDYKEALKSLTALLDEWETKATNASQQVDPITAFANELETGKLSIQLKKLGDEADYFRDRLIAAFTAVHDAALAKLSVELQIKIDAAAYAGYQKASGLAASYDQIGSGITPAAQALQTAQQTGFKDFTDALSELSRQTELQARKLAEVDQLKFDGDTKAAEQAQRLAENAKDAADKAKEAADKWKDAAEKAQNEFDASLTKLAHGVEAVGNQLLSKLGDLGTVIQSGVQGFQQGGWWGAIAAVLIEVFSHYQRFAEILDIGTKQLGGFIDELAPVFSKLTDGFEDFMKTMGILTQLVGTIAGPAIREVGRMFQHVGEVLAPILNSLEILLKPLMQLVSMFQDLMDAIEPLQFAIKAVSVIFNLVSLSILGTEEGILTAVAKFLDAIRQFAGSLGLDDIAKALGKAENDVEIQANNVTDQINQIKDNLADPYAAGSGVGGDGSGGSGTFIATNIDKASIGFNNVTNQVDKTTTALAAMTQQLYNVPQGFKYALDKFNATNPGNISAPGKGLPSSLPPITIIIQGSLIGTMTELAGTLEKVLAQQAFQSTGVPALNTNPYVKPPL